jgi:GNAT superfamily N-acetyltransferase
MKFGFVLLFISLSAWSQGIQTFNFTNDEQVINLFLNLNKINPQLMSAMSRNGKVPIELMKNQNKLAKLLNEYKTIQKYYSNDKLIKVELQKEYKKLVKELSEEGQKYLEGITSVDYSSYLPKESQNRSFMGLSTALTHQLPNNIKGKAFSLQGNEKIEFLKGYLPETFHEGFRFNEQGFAKMPSKVEAIQALKDILERESKTNIALFNLIIQIDSNEPINRKLSPEFIKNNLPSEYKKYEKSLNQFIKKNIANHIVENEVNELATEYTLQEVQPWFGIFRGYFGGDCSTSFSFPFPNDPNERVFFIQNKQGLSKGYMALTILKDKNKNKRQAYIHTINGSLNSDAVRASLLAADALKKELNVENILLPVERRVYANINSTTIRSIFRQFSSKDDIKITYKDLYIRNKIVNFKVENNHGSYDTPSENTNAHFLERIDEVDFKVKKSITDAYSFNLRGIKKEEKRGFLISFYKDSILEPLVKKEESEDLIKLINLLKSKNINSVDYFYKRVGNLSNKLNLGPNFFKENRHLLVEPLVKSKTAFNEERINHTIKIAVELMEDSQSYQYEIVKVLSKKLDVLYSQPKFRKFYKGIIEKMFNPYIPVDSYRLYSYYLASLYKEDTEFENLIIDKLKNLGFEPNENIKFTLATTFAGYKNLEKFGRKILEVEGGSKNFKEFKRYLSFEVRYSDSLNSNRRHYDLFFEAKDLGIEEDKLKNIIINSYYYLTKVTDEDLVFFSQFLPEFGPEPFSKLEAKLHTNDAFFEGRLKEIEKEPVTKELFDEVRKSPRFLELEETRHRIYNELIKSDDTEMVKLISNMNFVNYPSDYLEQLIKHDLIFSSSLTNVISFKRWTRIFESDKRYYRAFIDHYVYGKVDGIFSKLPQAFFFAYYSIFDAAYPDDETIAKHYKRIAKNLIVKESVISWLQLDESHKRSEVAKKILQEAEKRAYELGYYDILYSIIRDDETNFEKYRNTLPVEKINWNNFHSSTIQFADKEKLYEFLMNRIKIDTDNNDSNMVSALAKIYKELDGRKKLAIRNLVRKVLENADWEYTYYSFLHNFNFLAYEKPDFFYPLVERFINTNNSGSYLGHIFYDAKIKVPDYILDKIYSLYKETSNYYYIRGLSNLLFVQDYKGASLSEFLPHVESLYPIPNDGFSARQMQALYIDKNIRVRFADIYAQNIIATFKKDKKRAYSKLLRLKKQLGKEQAFRNRMYDAMKRGGLYSDELIQFFNINFIPLTKYQLQDISYSSQRCDSNFK